MLPLRGFSCLFQIVLKFGFHRSTFPFPNFAQSDLPLVALSIGDSRWHIVAHWLEIARWSQWRAYRKLPSLFSRGIIADPLRPPFPQKCGIPKCTVHDQRVLPPGEYEDINKISFFNLLHTSDVVFFTARCTLMQSAVLR